MHQMVLLLTKQVMEKELIATYLDVLFEGVSAFGLGKCIGCVCVCIDMCVHAFCICTINKKSFSSTSYKAF